MMLRENSHPWDAMRSALFWFGSLILPGLLVLLVACRPTATVDVPASNMDVKITVLDTDESPSDGKVPVVMQFLSSGTLVQLGGAATVTCNGVPLSFGALGHAARVPIAPIGGTYHFQHTRSGASTSVSVTAPQRPGFVSPAQGATVTRSNNLTLTYVAASGSGVRGSAGDGSIGLSGNLQSDNGTYTGFNVSSLNAAAGSIGLTREFTSTPAGTGFRSVETKYSSGSSIKVTWN